ncbi:unnamed protein product [Medioppia subpectinata]|uniref:Sulfotransferase domain-containing protein n=1 Tax=Medioppia subpectinata TaxID=1979941 RepID=A0A7R9L861_9ACAR|nr:unnamed protein product [Medioppia subpectinata]CAG2116796.1 unnamed protein product [Medioppia subpectinata]
MKGLKQSFKKLGRSKSIASVGSGGQGWDGQEKEALIDRSIKRVAYLESFPKVIDYMGYELPGDVINPKVLDNIQDLDVRESDIFIVSYPQSGASAVEELVLKLVDKMLEKQPQGRRQRSASVSRLEAAHPYGHLRWLNALKSPRILASNLPLALMPDSVKTPVCKIIYVLRNPKDQSVSYYYQHRVKGILSSFDDFISLYMCGHLLYGDYFSHS